MTHAEPRQGDPRTEQPDGLTTEQLDGLTTERPNDLAADRPAGLTAERLSGVDAGRPSAPDAEPPQDRPSTEQIARAGEATPEPQAESTERALARSPHGDEEHRAALLDPDDLESMVDRWREIQASFVDAPRNAVKDADALVAELMQEMARMFASQREQLESSWSAGDSVSTEDLRQGLQRYRSFFERLLAA
jgi:hypothetical protein